MVEVSCPHRRAVTKAERARSVNDEEAKCMSHMRVRAHMARTHYDQSRSSKYLMLHNHIRETTSRLTMSTSHKSVYVKEQVAHGFTA